MLKNSTSWPMIGGTVAAIGASLCCVGPLILLLLGVSGAWISGLTALEPYRPLFIIVVLMLFGFSGWQLFKPPSQCQPDGACSAPIVRLRRQVIYGVTLTIALIMISSPYWVPYILQ